MFLKATSVGLIVFYEPQRRRGKKIPTVARIYTHISKKKRKKERKIKAKIRSPRNAYRVPADRIEK